jgi:pimeloyl-ACP methyl ester carboxylesterase
MDASALRAGAAARLSGVAVTIAPIAPIARAGRARWRRLPWRAVLLAALALPLAGCAWLDTKQRELALRPTPTQPTEVAALRDGDLRYRVPAVPPAEPPQVVAMWWLPHTDPQAPTLLYLHGTFRNLYRNLPKIDALRDAGFAVLAVDYRGWGDSTPIVPSEETIVADAWLAWAELVRRQPEPGRRVIYGHSMGGTVAVTLASQLHAGTDYGALIVESSFSTMPEVAAAAGFWGSVGASITTLQFDALSKIGRVDAPVLMLHGSADRTVPIELGRRLRDTAPPGTVWVEIDGGTHSRLHEQAPQLYRSSLRALIDKLPTDAKP